MKISSIEPHFLTASVIILICLVYNLYCDTENSVWAQDDLGGYFSGIFTMKVDHPKANYHDHKQVYSGPLECFGTSQDPDFHCIPTGSWNAFVSIIDIGMTTYEYQFTGIVPGIRSCNNSSTCGIFEFHPAVPPVGQLYGGITFQDLIPPDTISVGIITPPNGWNEVITIDDRIVASGSYSDSDCGDGCIRSWEWDIELNSAVSNIPPVANAGPDQTAFTGDLVTLDGTQSWDSDGDPLIYSWTQVAGASVILSNSSSVSPTFVVPEVSTDPLVFQLIVNDGQQDSRPDTVSITVQPSGSFKIECPNDTKMLRNTSLQLSCMISSFNGFNNSINLSCQSYTNPTISCLVNPDTVTPPRDGNISVNLTLVTGPTTSLGDHNLDIKGTSGNLEIHENMTVSVVGIKLSLSSNEITPKIGRVSFSGVIPVLGAPSTHTQPEVEGGQTNLVAKIMGMDGEDENIQIVLQFDPQKKTGGHDHLTRINDNAKMGFGGFDVSGILQIRHTGTTDSVGEFQSTFKASNLNNPSQSSAGGIIEFKAKAQVPGLGAISSDAVKLTIRVPSLQALPDGPAYDLVGTCPGEPRPCKNHLQNHYGTIEVNNALQNIANDYILSHPGAILRYNDQSLVYGGIFDINGNFRGSHHSHSCGTDIDIGITAVDRSIRIDAEDLATLARQHFPGAIMIEEDRGRLNHHYHIHFVDCK